MPPASKEARPSKSEYDPQVDDRSWDPEAHAHAVNIHNQNLGAEGDASRKGSVGRRISNSLSQLTGRQSRSSTVDVEMADLSVSGADAIDGGSAEK